ncbi:MAG: hypothetical protein HY201_04440 [Nitrospirae bacterium]|nr:hypothetical protein [Candidatus Troglogloeales bacterium]MBI3598678.1 hypothetical protein [Candidatus Troglogloeales bacterium]
MLEENLFEGWLWEMFSEYVRKIRRTASTGAPPIEGIKEKYKQIFHESSVKFLVEEKVGMIVVFNELEERTTGELRPLMDLLALMAYLAKTYGHGKYKINLYHGMTFVATHNFKVEDESLPEHWREIVAKNKGRNHYK